MPPGAGAPDRQVATGAHDEVLAGLLAGATPGDGLALEVGSYSPARSEAFRALGWSYVTMDGVDGSDGVVDPRHRLRGTLERAAYLPDEAFDAVVLVDQVERMPAPWEAAAHVARILKPGGWVYVESGVRAPQETDAAAPWSLGQAALRALFAGLEECASAAGGAAAGRVRYAAAKPARHATAVAAREDGCPVCGGSPGGTGERHDAYDQQVLSCQACGHAFVDAGGNVESQPPQSRARVDFYVLNVLRHLPIGSVLDLHPTPGNDLLRGLRGQLPGVRAFALQARGPGDGDIATVSTPAEAGQVDLAVGLLVLPFLAPADLASYARTVAEVARWFVFEVPVGDDTAGRETLLRGSTQRHFFSRRSLQRLFDGTGARVHAMAGFGPRRAPVLVAYRLPGDAVMTNGLVLDAG